MKKSWFTLMTMLVLLSLVVAGCGPTAEPTQAPGQEATQPPEATQPTEETAPPEEEGVTGTITLWQSWKEEEIAVLNKVIAAFQETNPDVQFDVLYVPFDDLRGKFETAAATGGGPTVPRERRGTRSERADAGRGQHECPGPCVR